MRTTLQWFQEGGPIIVPLVITGVVGLLTLIERLVYIVLRSRIHARPFMERVISLARAGKLDEALAICTQHQSALPDLGLVILRSRDAGAAGLRHVAETATLTVVPTFKRRLAWLPTLAQLAILLGLLGAAANMHDALVREQTFTTALTYALRPFAVGLLMAIPLVVGHAYLASESQTIVGQLEEFAVRLVDALIDRPDVRLGHRS
jgi:biopolymer transport protein ExbB/TolQ